MTVTVVDLGVGNVPNVVRAFRRLAADVEVVLVAEKVPVEAVNRELESRGLGDNP